MFRVKGRRSETQLPEIGKIAEEFDECVQSEGSTKER